MGAAVHRIRRQRWEVRAGSQPLAFAIRSWLRTHYDSELQDALEAAFDRVAPGDRVVRLDRLVIHLKVDQMDRLAELLPAKVAAAIATPLSKGAADGAVASAGSATDSAEERLIAYLLTGTVPWPMRPGTAATQAELSTVACAAGATIAASLPSRTSDARTLNAAIFRLLQLVGADDRPAIAAAARQERSPSASTSRPTAPSPPDLLENAASSDVRRPVPQEVVRAAAGRRGMQQSGNGTPRRDAADLSERSVDDRGAPHSSAPDVLQTSAPSPGRDTDADRMRLDVLHALETSPIPPTRPHTTDFATAVAYAGLVLVHPYLPQFFRASNVVLSSDPDPAAPDAVRAAALLHYVATGGDDPYELDLGFIKILLGLRPDQPLLASAGTLTDTDRAEGDALVSAVVEHWRALKHTSPAVLRMSFLRRPGFVKADENGWRLHVERGPFDVLLNRLPWSLAVVKLPWMTQPVHCEWPTL